MVRSRAIRRFNMKHLVTQVLFITLIISNLLYAGNQGKLIGKVVDGAKNEPLPGATVVVVGTQRGATTDIDGKYTIIGINIGTYTVRASLVGYSPAEVKNIRIGADETTLQNFKLSETGVELSGVEITAQELIVNPYATSSQTKVSEKEIQSIPNVKTVDDVLKLQAGVVKQGGNIYLRGGRADEVVYLVDGVPTNNVLSNSGDLTTSGANADLARLYSGASTGISGGGLSISANAIASVNVQASSFDADYGNAQSGIVNIVTKSGSDRFTGSLQYRTDKLGNNNQNERYSSAALGGPEPLTKYLLPNLGIDIPGSVTFFVNADVDRSDSYAQYNHDDYFHPIERKINLNGFLGGLFNGLGFTYRDNQSNSYTFNSKFRYALNAENEFSYGYRASLSSNHGYNAYWKYRADSSSIGASLSVQHNLSWQHFLGKETYFKFFIAKLESRDGNDVAGITPDDYSRANSEKYDVNDDGFYELGTSQRWYSAVTTQWSTRFDFVSQLHPLHLLKTGAEFYLEHINSTDIRYPTYKHGTTEIPDPNPIYSRGLWPGYGLFRYYINQYPSHGALYLQDNIELSGLNIHLGLRYDFFDIGAQVYDGEWIDYWKSAYHWTDSSKEPGWIQSMPGSTREEKLKNGRDDLTRFWYFFTHGFYSPRLSIGYPVTERIVFYFNYGHFYQYADRADYYSDPYLAQSGNGVTIGNPSLKPKKNISYEAGFDDQFSDDMAFKVAAFYKDIFDYETKVPRNGYYFMQNLDYASTRGFEFRIQESMGNNFQVVGTYSYQIAKGRSSNKNDVEYNPQNFLLAREVRLSWDQNHTANLLASYRVGPTEEGQFFGLPFVNNYGISLTWSYGSGYPYDGYNPYGSKENTAQQNRRINSETSPYTMSVDLSIYKGLRLFETVNLMVTLDVTNLFDRKNPTRDGIYNYTGSVYKYGDYGDASQKIIEPWRRTEIDFLSPYNFDPPRQILLGLRLNWD
jgi:outer membrane receptor protein involved in Fe transport